MQKNYHKNISCTYCDDAPEPENMNNTSQPISAVNPMLTNHSKMPGKWFCNLRLTQQAPQCSSLLYS